jgi:aryl-alcohol dehydrogenase-like predicted oxidoreductase
MHTRSLGQQGLVVSALGLGCMGMSYAYGPADEAESLAVLRRAHELGMTFWDTAELYGPFKNEELLGKAIAEIGRENVVVATKFAFRYDAAGQIVGLDSRPESVVRAVEGSLRRLGTEYIDLIYQHRLDPAVPIEETMGALKGLIEAGKARFAGLSEVGPGTIRRAHAVHPLSAVQSEYSPWERGVEHKVLPALRALGIGFVAYSPLGRGFLTGRWDNVSDLPEGDWRRTNPRFQEENFAHNQALVDVFRAVASEVGATPAQVVLAWGLRRGDDIVPIPGTKRLKYLEENAGAASLGLSADVWARLDAAVGEFQAAGTRYSEMGMRSIDESE